MKLHRKDRRQSHLSRIFVVIGQGCQLIGRYKLAGLIASLAEMQEIIANSDGVMFDVEMALEQQLGAQPLPFPGMDSNG